MYCPCLSWSYLSVRQAVIYHQRTKLDQLLYLDETQKHHQVGQKIVGAMLSVQSQEVVDQLH